MGGFATALELTEDAARTGTQRDGAEIDPGVFLPYVLADNQLIAEAPALPDIPTATMLDYFKTERPEGKLTPQLLQQIASLGDQYLSPTAKYLHNNFSKIVFLGNEAEIDEITDNDLDILAVLMDVDAKHTEAKIAAHALKVKFRDIDANNDGQLTKDEVSDYAKAHTPDFDRVLAASRSQWSVIADADADSQGVSWTDAANVANNDAARHAMENEYVEHQVNARGWFIDYAVTGIGAGAGYWLTRGNTWGARAGGTAVGGLVGYVVGDEIKEQAFTKGVRQYYQNSAGIQVNDLFRLNEQRPPEDLPGSGQGQP